MKIILSVFLSAEIGFAQTKEAKPQVQKVDFSQVELAGKRERPDGILISPKPKSYFENLIRIRGDFNDKLDSSVDG